MNGIGKNKFVGLDSNIFIYHFEDNPQFASTCRKVLDKLLRNQLTAVTSVITIIELLSYPSPPNTIKLIKDAFFEIPNLKLIEINIQIAIEAAKIRRDYKFHTPDSVQLATALNSHARVFITNDKKLKKFKELNVILLNEI